MIGPSGSPGGGRFRRREPRSGHEQAWWHDLVSEAPHERPAALGSSAELVVERGPTQGRRYALARERAVVLGRGRECDVLLPDSSVSRRHAEIRYEHNRFVVYDLESLNGMYHNDEWITSAALADGDMLTIGIFRLLCRRESPAH